MKKNILGVFLGSLILLISPTFIYAVTGDYDNTDQTTSCIDLKNNIKYRSTDLGTSGEVSLLQGFLQDNGFLQSEPTGFFGRMSVTAVQNYQASIGLDKTGYVGPLTRAKIKASTCEGQGSNTDTTTKAQTSPISDSTNKNDQTKNSDASVVFTLDSASPSYQVVTADTTGVDVASFKVRAIGGSATLESVDLRLVSGNPDDLVAVNIWDGATLIGTGGFFGTAKEATVTLSSPVKLEKDTDKLLTIKVDISPIGIGRPAKSGDLITLAMTGLSGHKDSREVLKAKGYAVSAGIRIYKSYPTFNYSTMGGRLIYGVNDLMNLKVSADSHGEVQLKKLMFYIDTKNINVSNITFTGPNGNVTSTTNASISGNYVTVNFDSSSNRNDAVIPAGQTKQYTLRGTISVTGQGATLSIKLLGDNQVPLGLSANPMTSANAVDSKGAGSRIIWSPSSTTTVDATGADWTNGYGLMTGCFSMAGLGNDCHEVFYYNEGLGFATPSQTAPTINFSASPTSVSENQSTVLSWSTTNSTSCSATGGWSGTRDLNGSMSVVPVKTSSTASSASYTITCSGAGGSTSKTVTVDIVSSQNSQKTTDPSAQLLINGVKNGLVSVGEKVTYTYSAQNADQFSGSFTTDKCVSGTQSLPFDSASGSYSGTFSANSAGCTYTVTYTAKQSSTGKTSTATVTVYIAPQTSTLNTLDGSQTQNLANIISAMQKLLDQLRRSQGI